MKNRFLLKIDVYNTYTTKQKEKCAPYERKLTNSFSPQQLQKPIARQITKTTVLKTSKMLIPSDIPYTVRTITKPNHPSVTKFSTPKIHKTKNCTHL